MRCWCGRDRRSRWAKFEKHLWDGQIGGRAMEKRGKKSRLTTMFLRTGIHCNNEKDGTDSGKDIKFKFETSVRLSDGKVLWGMVLSVYIIGQRTEPLCPNYCHNPIPVHHPDILALFQLQARERTLKTTVVPCHKLFLTPVNNLLNQSEIWYIVSRLFLITRHPIGNMKIQTGACIYVIFFFWKALGASFWSRLTF